MVSMVGYENHLALVYHSGPSIYGCQALKVKIYDMSNRNYNILYDIECPISRYSNLVWLGYSEEGMLFTFDSEGLLRTLNPLNKQWVPVIDFKYKFPETFA